MTKQLLTHHPLPVSRVTDGFNPDRGHVPGFGNLGPHRGIDLVAPAGAPIRAAHDGTVRRKYFDNAGGNLIYLTGTHDGVTFETSYQHMIQPARVAEGQKIGAGTVIGYVGKTGFATGDHLHLELWINGIAWSGGTAVDPAPYLKAVQVSHALKKRKRKGTKMIMIHTKIDGQQKYAVFGGGMWLEFTGSKTASLILEQMTGKKESHSVPVSKDFWHHCKKSVL